MTSKAEYEGYRQRVRGEGRAALTAFVIVGVLLLFLAVRSGFANGFALDELLVAGGLLLFFVMGMIFLPRIYRQLADALVRRRQRLRNDPVDPDNIVVNWVDEGRIDDILEPHKNGEG